MDNATQRRRLLESLDRSLGTVHRTEIEGGIVQEGTSRGLHAHGPFRQWFPNGQLRLERHYRASQLDGLCRQYSSDGELLAEFVMTDGDGIFLEYWDTGKLKIRWWHFHLHDKHCGIMECFDINGEHATRTYTWKGGPCRTKKRFMAELEKCGLTIPPADKLNDPAVWAEFARRTREVPPPKKRN